jgi:spore coat protein U-like protein
MRKILTALVALVSLFATVPVVAPATITGTVVVELVCDIAVSPDLNFSSMKPGDISALDVTTVVSMPTGNTELSPTIEGSPWTGGTGMLVGQTHYDETVSNDPYVSMSTLTGSPVSLTGKVKYGTNLPVYFKLAIPAGQAAASYTQTITFTASC